MSTLIIILAEHVDSARALAEAAFGLPPEEAAVEFAPCGSPTGGFPATHYWISGVFNEVHLSMLEQLSNSLPWAAMFHYDAAQQPEFPFSKRAEMGLQPLPDGGPA